MILMEEMKGYYMNVFAWECFFANAMTFPGWMAFVILQDVVAHTRNRVSEKTMARACRSCAIMAAFGALGIIGFIQVANTELFTDPPKLATWLTICGMCFVFLTVCALVRLQQCYSALCSC